MTCADYELQIGDLVDGTLAAPARQALEVHLAGCAACRHVLEDLRAIGTAIGKLEQHAPQPQVWNRIAAAIEADRGRSPWQRMLGIPPFGWSQLAATMVAVTLVATIGWMAWRDLAPLTPPDRGSAATNTATGPNQDLIIPAADVKVVEDQYVKEIAGLEEIRKTGETALDAGTADVVQANITVLDQAIVESRAALVTEPENQVAQDSLFQALRSKVELLQDAIALINEMRQGNQEGAARIVSGQNQ